jgi:hypothetical protein
VDGKHDPTQPQPQHPAKTGLDLDGDPFGMSDSRVATVQEGRHPIQKSAFPLTSRLTAAVDDVSSGATGVARQVIDGLLELADDLDRLRAAARVLVVGLPWCAPMWQIARATQADQPALALRSLRDRLSFDVDRSVAVAVKLLTERGCCVRTAPGSGLVAAVTRALPTPNHATTVTGVAGVVGADALGPTAMLNVVGTDELARAMPTIIVTTSIKLVPDEAFGRLSAPGFERVPLRRFESVVLDGEVLAPAEAGQRASALSHGS